jgi:hypothetical protein
VRVTYSPENMTYAVHIRYWLPDLLKHKHIALRFLPQQVYEAAAPLSVSPSPCNVTRIFILWKGLLPCEIDEEEGWEEAGKRAKEMDIGKWRDVVGLETQAIDDKGLRVLEWGGMEVN